MTTFQQFQRNLPRHVRRCLPGRPAVAGLAGAAMLAAGAGIAPVLADSGDLLRVTAERANVRAGPSDETDVLTQVLLNDEVIELRREGSWVGVRVARTGEEGWIYGDLVTLEERSMLEGGQVVTPLPLPDDFARTIDRLGDAFGYGLVADYGPVEDGTLTVTPTEAFLRNAGREAHVATTLVLYEMWKAHMDGQTVAVTLTDDAGAPYVTIRDDASGASQPTIELAGS